MAAAAADINAVELIGQRFQWYNSGSHIELHNEMDRRFMVVLQIQQLDLHNCKVIISTDSKWCN
jgi:NOL1/NOP2/fmu family ribosome biogenesis protein